MTSNPGKMTRAEALNISDAKAGTLEALLNEAAALLEAMGDEAVPLPIGAIGSSGSPEPLAAIVLVPAALMPAVAALALSGSPEPSDERQARRLNAGYL